jgi:hypothetical protein
LIKQVGGSDAEDPQESIDTKEKSLRKRNRGEKSGKGFSSESDEEGYDMTTLYKEEKSKLKKLKRFVVGV